ncbi:MAG TPA: RbsD/FucU domain-containing protein [Arenibaculum sp.]|nr:RbsD/FucU domain-containing protein [Arenibaculum sp.]
MLKRLDPLLHADLLYVLAAMGHGDEIALVDGHFPAVSLGNRVVRLDGATIPRALEAVLTLLPLDDMRDTPATRMEAFDEPEDLPEICAELQSVIEAVEGPRWRIGRLDRQSFYHRTRAAFAVVVTGETRPHGNLLLTKGILKPDAS